MVLHQGPAVILSLGIAFDLQTTASLFAAWQTLDHPDMKLHQDLSGILPLVEPSTYRQQAICLLLGRPWISLR